MSHADAIDGPAVTVSVDGKTHTLRDGSSLGELLARLGHEPEAVAVAVNGDFVPRAGRGNRVLQNGDQVVCFKPIVGG